MRREVKNPSGSFVYPVSVITVRHKDIQNGLTAAWTFPVSIDPLIYATSVGHTRYSHDLMMASDCFGINLLADDQVFVSNHFGMKSGMDIDKFGDPKVGVYEAREIDCPLLDGCAANIECIKLDAHSHGDHTIFVGEAKRVEVDDEKAPLIYGSAKYFSKGEQVGIRE